MSVENDRDNLGNVQFRTVELEVYRISWPPPPPYREVTTRGHRMQGKDWLVFHPEGCEKSTNEP